MKEIEATRTRSTHPFHNYDFLFVNILKQYSLYCRQMTSIHCKKINKGKQSTHEKRINLHMIRKRLYSIYLFKEVHCLFHLFNSTMNIKVWVQIYAIKIWKTCIHTAPKNHYNSDKQKKQERMIVSSKELQFSCFSVTIGVLCKKIITFTTLIMHKNKTNIPLYMANTVVGTIDRKHATETD